MARRSNRRSSQYKTVKKTAKKSHTIETLEPRVVMSANPISGPMFGTHSVVDDMPAMTQHQAPVLEQHNFAPILEQSGLESTAGHDPDADFWLGAGSSLDLLEDLDRQIEQNLREGHALTGQDDVVNTYGFKGTGQTVAVIDSGIAYNHFALGGGMGEGYRVVGGWDFTENDADFYDDGPSKSAAHGTHVAGIVGAAGGGTHQGVATDVDLVGLRVFDDAGNGYFSWVEQALQWVHTNRNAFDNPITAVNLSLGLEQNSFSVPNWSQLEDEFAQLEAAGIFISVSAGNSFADYNTKGLSYPAASPHVIPVMATGNNDTLAPFSQRAERAIAAPGRWITSTVPDYAANDGDTIDDDYLSMSGTSMASPYVAGASVLIREAMEFARHDANHTDSWGDIDQWDIYNHMIDTAVTFTDSATSTDFQRLDLKAAIDAIIPEDDFGSSVATAHNLGTLNDTSSATPLSMISGSITTLDDADHFSFTAGVTGVVTISAASASHAMTASWEAWGGTWSTNEAGDCVLDVVAGETYRVGLSTSNGLGYYDLDVSVESTFAAVELGAIGPQEIRTLELTSNETWFAVTAGRTGYFTAETLTESGSASVAIYDAQQNLIATAGSRADVQATAGETLMLRVTGDATDLDLRMTNALSVGSGIATLVGTAGEDAISFSRDSSASTVALNGVQYTVSTIEASVFEVDASGGRDTVSAVGSSADESVVLGANNLRLTSAGFELIVRGAESIEVDSGGGTDTALLYGSSGRDTYRSYNDRVVMSGEGFLNKANGFSVTHGIANDSSDVAFMHGSDGADVYRAYSDRVVMSGSGYYNRALGFTTNWGYADSPNDVAMMYGSDGIDEYRVSSTHAVMSGAEYNNTAVGFGVTYAVGGGVGDQAWMYASAGADTYSTYDDRVAMAGAGYYNRAEGFEKTYGFANGADDTAWMFGSTGADDYRTYDDRVVMSGTDYYNRAVGFSRSWGFGDASDTATMYDSPGKDEYRTSGTHAIMSGAGFYNAAVRFGNTNGYATTSGDQAWMYGSNGDDTYRGYSDRVEMVGEGYSNIANGFTLTYAFSNSSADIAYLYDSGGNDNYRAYEDRSIMSSDSYYNRVIGFKQISAYSTAGVDSAYLYDGFGDDIATVRDEGVALDYSIGVSISAEGFDSVHADGSAGGTNTLDEVAVDYYFNSLGTWS